MKRLLSIIGIMLVLSDQETPDKTLEHYTDAEFHAQSKYRVHSGQFSTIPDIIWDSMCEILRISDDDHQDYYRPGE